MKQRLYKYINYRQSNYRTLIYFIIFNEMLLYNRLDLLYGLKMLIFFFPFILFLQVKPLFIHTA